MPYLDIINACAYNVYQALSSALGGGAWGRGYGGSRVDPEVRVNPPLLSIIFKISRRASAPISLRTPLSPILDPPLLQGSTRRASTIRLAAS